MEAKFYSSTLTKTLMAISLLIANNKLKFPEVPANNNNISIIPQSSRYFIRVYKHFKLTG